jgi:hypothetical protein
MNLYISFSLTNRKSSVHLHALYPPSGTKDVYTQQRSARDLWTVGVKTVVYLVCYSAAPSALDIIPEVMTFRRNKSILTPTKMFMTLAYLEVMTQWWRPLICSHVNAVPHL